MNRYATSARAAAIGILAGSTLAAAGDHPRIINMGVPPGGSLSRANAVSADGTIVAGSSNIGAVRWRGPGEWDVIGFGQGAWSTVTTGISADGSVVVGYDTEFEYRWGFRWTPAGGRQRVVEPGWGSTAIFGVSDDGSVMVGGVSTFHVSLRQLRPFNDSAGPQR